MTTAIHYGTGEVHYVESNDTLRLCDSKNNPNCQDLQSGVIEAPKQRIGRTCSPVLSRRRSSGSVGPALTLH